MSVQVTRADFILSSSPSVPTRTNESRASKQLRTPFYQKNIVSPRQHCAIRIRCTIDNPTTTNRGPALKTCRNCKTQFDPLLNSPRACRFHTAHFGGETKRKFESVYAGGTMDTPNSGQVFQYWHCCGSEDPFDAGCTAAPHQSYDD